MSILQTVDLKKHYRQGDNVTKALDGRRAAADERRAVAAIIPGCFRWGLKMYSGSPGRHGWS